MPPMLPKKLLASILSSKFGLPKTAIKNYAVKAAELDKDLEEYLTDEALVDERTLYEETAKAMRVSFTTLKDRDIKKEVLNLLPLPLAEAQKVIAFDKSKDEVSVAMLDPEDMQTIEFIERKTGLKPKIFLTTVSDVRETLRRYHAELDASMGATTARTQTATSAPQFQTATGDTDVVALLTELVEHAIYQEASDIHIEPRGEDVHVRFRVDGVLRPVMALPAELKEALTARIKILANLKIDEHMQPQDGRFSVDLHDEHYSFRVSIVPMSDGEKIVLRLLHESERPLSLDELGLLPEQKQLVEEAIQKPHGMLLATGPTGSGKTTTLYSLLGMLNTADVNIITVEDPIEYHVAGINQSQVNQQTGFTFAKALRSFLRQDPDILMVGEIRDQETAEIAIHAAMTGHLVLSTLHTNDAPTALPRLVDMGIPPFLVSFTTNVIIAQRLVRRICEHCKKEFALSAQAIKELSDTIHLKKLVAILQKNGIRLPAKEKDLARMTFYRGAGCKKCGMSGYRGRIGIFEVLDIDETIAKKINERATAADIAALARENGMMTLLEDGLVKAKKGLTTVEEVLRATKD
ncbi:MAG: hypothetical protein A3C90_01395 [Candidatus Magasanikbacteria bacterium RIFCSPHIGHO2_02_FULL_51_14]|uniref:Bacterial type II secretion system protein E domain-containing protein n=1 Tax=Candidatus Magasanikbacteria bacterium RIFCSPHIGHO2_02_FULL_51_14 TaxID=1798683 RepID=A0A1F6MHI4_9BACT|nr:MAG: hypothetical protein A3C90_01395 [Candidatus Magasanikbacteria bacterium RIFCSPHIGHO2_02_FULL_51_14]